MHDNCFELPPDKAESAVYEIVQQEVAAGTRAFAAGDPKIAIMCFQSAIQKLQPDQPFHDHLVHNLLICYVREIKRSLSLGDREMAERATAKALVLEVSGPMRTVRVFCQKFAAVLQDLSICLFDAGLFDLSLAACRKAVTIHRSPGSKINLSNILAMTGEPAHLSDLTTEITEQQLGRHVFIACAPKSGSTFLKKLLVSITGYRDAFVVNSSSQFEQELYLPSLVNSAAEDTVSQVHCRASFSNVQMMQAFRIRPVILVRNIFDSVISLLDHFEAGGSGFSYFRSDFHSFDRETKLDLLIDHFVPWYYQFAASWSMVDRSRSLEVLWVRYEDMLHDKLAAFEKVLRFYGLGAAKRSVAERVREIETDRRGSRINKGVSGRGVAALSREQKERIVRLGRYFPSTDLSMIGL